jgi:hypothetical protein
MFSGQRFAILAMFAYVPPSAININQLRTFDQKYFLAKHAIYARQLYICGKKTSSSWIYEKKYLFVKISLDKLF